MTAIYRYAEEIIQEKTGKSVRVKSESFHLWMEKLRYKKAPPLNQSQKQSKKNPFIPGSLLVTMLGLV